MFSGGWLFISLRINIASVMNDAIPYVAPLNPNLNSPANVSAQPN